MNQEIRSSEIHIATEGLYTNAAGNQLSSFRANLNEAPFSVGDDERLRIRPTTAFVQKNWTDINQTNMWFRVFAANPNTNFAPYDLMFSIEEKDYATHESFTNAFCSALQTTLNASTTAAAITTVVAATAPENFAATTNSSNGANAGQLLPSGSGTSTFNPTLDFTITVQGTGSGDFTASQIPTIQCLQLDLGETYILAGRGGASTGGAVAQITLSADQKHNDSYILCGTKRITEFVPVTLGVANPITASNTSWKIPAIAGKVATYLAPWRMNYSLNTLPFLFLRCQSTLNQGSTNYNLFDGVNQTKSIVHNDIIAKLRRTYSRENLGIISYELQDNASFYSYVATRQLSNIVFSVVDKNGRPIPTQNYNDATFVGNQDEVGNLMIDMSLKIEIDRREMPPPRSGQSDLPRTFVMSVGGPNAPSDLPTASPQMSFMN